MEKGKNQIDYCQMPILDYILKMASKEPRGFSEKKKRVFSEKGGGNSVNEGFGKDFHRKGNSVKRSGPFNEPPDSEN